MTVFFCQQLIWTFTQFCSENSLCVYDGILIFVLRQAVSFVNLFDIVIFAGNDFFAIFIN